jgi:hypothetical protein
MSRQDGRGPGKADAKRSILRVLICLLFVVAVPAFCAAPAAAAAGHTLIGAITGERIAKGEQFRDACGVAVDSHGDVYVADYFDNRVVVFNHEWKYLTQIDGIDPLDSGGVRPLNGPCDLAVDSTGELYVDSYHGALRRYIPTVYPPGNSTGYGPAQLIDPGPVTGIAVDPTSGDLYADRRTSIARWAAPVSPGAAPTQLIGEGDLEDGYGVALSGFEGDSQYASTEGYLYVADAGTDTVKAYDPSVSLTEPVQQIRGEGTAQGGFHLEDADVEVDPQDGHVYLSDDLQPGFEEEPELVVDEFSPAGYYRGSVPPSFEGGFPSFLRAGAPSGLAISGGDLYVSSGNWENAAVYIFGPPTPAETHTLTVTETGSGQGTVTSPPAGISCGPVCAGEFDAGSTVTLHASAAAGSAFAGWGGCDTEPAPGRCTVVMGSDREVTARFDPAPSGVAPAFAGAAAGPAAPAAAGPSPAPAPTADPSAAPAPTLRASSGHGAGATRVRKGGLEVALRGAISPQALPRHGEAPVAVSLGGQISTTDGSALPQLKRLQIALSRGGRLETRGLPTCPLSRIAIATTSDALRACRPALVGQGSFHADIVLHGQAPYPSVGRLLVFNATEHGRPALYGHIYSSKPFATSFVIRFTIARPAHGGFGTVLTAALPEALGSWWYVTAIQMRLSRRYVVGGHSRSYLSAGCPAPEGFPGAIFTLARTTFTFAGGKRLEAKLTRSCRAR